MKGYGGNQGNYQIPTEISFKIQVYSHYVISLVITTL
jgi:hypothetical protein